MTVAIKKIYISLFSLAQDIVVIMKAKLRVTLPLFLAWWKELQ